MIPFSILGALFVLAGWGVCGAAGMEIEGGDPRGEAHGRVSLALTLLGILCFIMAVTS